MLFKTSLSASSRILLIFLLSCAGYVHAQGTGYWHTSGNQILDTNNAVVRIAGINWYGFETTDEVVHGLWAQDYKTILNAIKSNGYNTVRIPLSNQMVEAPIVPSNIAYSNGSGSINTDLQGLNSLQILDKIVSYAGSIGLKIILDNHRSEAGNSAESNGLWYTSSYPESAWIADWQALANRYLNNTTIIGFDLRNEPHNATSGGSCWGCGVAANDWPRAAERAGNAVLGINPNLLIFVEGTDAYNNDFYWWGGNLEGVSSSPVTLNTANRLVYSAHDYGPTEYQQSWFNSSTTYSSLASVWTTHWAYISLNGIAPVWLGEFGTTNTDSDVENSTQGSQGQWFQSMVQFLSTNSSLDWTYWALNGEDRYGLLDSNYDSTPANALKQQELASIQFPLNSGGGSSAPAAPTNLTAVAQSSSQINLTWTASATSGVTYNLYRSTSSGVAATTANLIASGLTSTSYQNTGLTASTTYYYAITATASGTSSTPSGQASATTDASSGGGSASCHITYTDQNDWGSGFTGGISITNSGTTAIQGWILSWTWPGNQQITQSWSSSYTQSGKAVTLTNANWNSSISAGGSVTGIGFNANYSGTNTAPAIFTLNGTVCN